MTTITELLARPCTARKPGLAGYKIDRCRCHTCTTASLNHQNTRTRLRAYGQWQPYIDAAPTRQHVRHLMNTGMGWQRIARTAGVPTSTVNRLLYGCGGRKPSRRIRPTTAQALLNVQPQNANRTLIDATGARRRTQALAAIGWSVSEQARLLGKQVRNQTHHLHNTQVRVETARLVADLYERLATTPAPDGQSKTRTMRWAAKHGWAPPLAWDDDNIDDPSALPALTGPADDQPDLVVVERVLRGALKFHDASPAERLEVVRRLLRRGTRPGAMSKLFGISGRAALKLAAEATSNEMEAAA